MENRDTGWGLLATGDVHTSEPGQNWTLLGRDAWTAVDEEKDAEMAARFCGVCSDMFHEQFLRQERPHHQSTSDILDAASDGCPFCKIITQSRGFEHFGPDKEEFKASSDLLRLDHVREEGSDWFRLIIDAVGEWGDEGEELEEEEEGDESEGEDSGTSRRSEPVLEVGVDGKLSVCGKAPEAHEPRVFPPVWRFAMVPANWFQTDAGYKPPVGTGDNRLWSLATLWLDDCTENHPKCRSRKPDYQPTRLVEIMDETAVRVVLREDATAPQPYASFSHCWGQAKTLKLLRGNMSRLRTRIDTAELPCSYLEALGVATRLGVRFIWIDSLCIIQDSMDDWRAEAATMKDVYHNALINISASAAAENSESSFRRRDPVSIEPLQLVPEWEGTSGQQYILAATDSYRDEVEYSPLRSRCWVMQESFLSARNLSLTESQLWWECRESLMCEAWPNGVPEPLRYNPNVKSGTESEVAANHVVWSDLVEKYTACGLTVLSDKLMAIAGLAAHFQGLMGAGDVYVAGMWRSQLPEALCWESDNFTETYRTARYRAPSWSWASVEGSVGSARRIYGSSRPSITDLRAVVDVADVQVVPAGPDPYGDLAGGYLRLRGRLIPVDIWGSNIGVQNAEGEYDFLEGTDGNRNSSGPEGTNTTLVIFDEMANDVHAVVSYLDTSAIGELQDASLVAAARKSVLADDWKGRLFCLPVVEFARGGEPWVRGLVLGQADGEPPGRYQRMGSWRAVGAVAAPQLRRGEVQEFVVV